MYQIPNNNQLIRGTTPTFEITVKTEIDLHQVSKIWIYISQQNKVKVNKELKDVTFDYENRKMSITLTQDDTLGLKEGDAILQIRLLMGDVAMATIGQQIEVLPIYKDGVIE